MNEARARIGQERRGEEIRVAIQTGATRQGLMAPPARSRGPRASGEGSRIGQGFRGTAPEQFGLQRR